jgi:high-affinity nickel-transport protein
MALATLARTGSVPRRRSRLSRPERRRLVAMGAVVAALHITGFTMLLLAAHGHYRASATATFGLGTGMLAYSLGLRHAFDADHITAIDNTTRNLMAHGKHPVAVGFFFSLGHSSVVFVMTVLLNLGARALYGQVRDDGSSLHHYTSMLGTGVSGAFLMVIGLLNVAVLANIVKVFLRLRCGHYDEEQFEHHLDRRGLLNLIFGRLTRSVDTSWKMYPIGILFGLGFDTATEISLLVLAGTTVASGLPFWAILSLPILFAAGMSLLDTIDGSFMNFAYGWAFSHPVRKVYYNLTITGLSVAVAVFVGALEITQVLAGQFGLTGGVWDYAKGVDLNRAGYLIVGAFAVVWLVALAVWRLGRIEQRWETAAAGQLQTVDSIRVELGGTCPDG